MFQSGEKMCVDGREKGRNRRGLGEEGGSDGVGGVLLIVPHISRVVLQTDLHSGPQGALVVRLSVEGHRSPVHSSHRLFLLCPRHVLNYFL